MEMTIQEAQDIVNVLVQELNAARQEATNAKIQSARAQRELAVASAKIAATEAAEKQAPSNVVPLSASDAV
jgi:hypothetical protein